MTTSTTPAAASGTFSIGGDLEVTRLGFGAMRITGPGIWLDPPDPAKSIELLKRLPELGVDFIDTADSYGPAVSEELIREALHPYKGVTVATKGGLMRGGPDDWKPMGHPTYLRQACIMSLRRLGVDTIDLYQLHRIDTNFPAEEQFGVLKELQDEGLIRHVGLSEVSVDDITAARKVLPITTVQNLYNLGNRQSEAVLDYCEANDIGFIPWFPLNAGELAKPGGVVADIAERHEATTGQIALAWLLHRSPVMLPIPGTSSIEHLEENVAASAIQLSDEDIAAIDAASE